MRVLLVTDAWFPQVNGVVRTLDAVRRSATAEGHEIEVISPQGFRTLPCPTYPEIRLALLPGRRVAASIERTAPDAIHIATEGPLGMAARRAAMRRGLAFTTSFHTRFPDYVYARCGLPTGWTYAFLRQFHNAGAGVMAATSSLRAELEARGFRHVLPWSRGVDSELFRPRDKDFLPYPRPIWLHVGRLAVEKNVEAFLRLALPGTKLVVGDGPLRVELERRYPDAVYVGAKGGEELAQYYAASDVFVFPSRTDTFGLVLLEALASGLPVAAYPVPGPLDVIADSGTGALDEDLAQACRAALAIAPERCRAYASRFSWAACARQFLGNLRRTNGEASDRAAEAVAPAN
jgi:glycosyltransferase involved in cell wall biosynthesis